MDCLAYFDDCCPNFMYRSVGDIDFEVLYDRGIRYYVFDVDGTLVPGNKSCSVPTSIVETLRRNVDRGYIEKFVLVSNTTFPNEKREARIRKIAEQVGASDCHCAILPKTKPHPAPFQWALQRMASTPSNTAVVGDQLLTDVRGAMGCSCTSIYLNHLGRDPIHVAVKRPLEWILRKYWERLERQAYPLGVNSPRKR